MNSSGWVRGVYGKAGSSSPSSAWVTGIATTMFNSFDAIRRAVAVDCALDAPEYIADAAALGLPRGWIMLGHNVSEEPGMLEMAQWIKSFVIEVPVQLVKSGEPFWAPK